ncbi:MAG: hypothetical protein JST91_20410 [Actinobacteria bacterium]|nr:hypothetical protein [Actinomycetota bacterium]
MRTARLVAVGLLALVLFNFPLLAVFDTGTLIGGIPVLWAYLFGAWILVIALLAWITRSR